MIEKNTTGRETVGALLGIHALTSLHPGSGTALGTVDLPVQREKHTAWPNIAGTALKGILRDAVREKLKGSRNREDADSDPQIKSIFGPPKADNNAAAGALSVTDARIAAFPVRSFKGVFTWITCGALLERLVRDAAFAGIDSPFKVVKPAKDDGALVAADSPCLHGKNLILEEFEFEREEVEMGTIAGWIASQLLPEDQSTRNRMLKQLVILSDDWFTYLVKHATEITARIALNYDTKTVRKGALFYQEFLPTETLFYAVTLMNASRSGTEGGARSLMQTLSDHLPPVLQIGGDETTGKGYCATRLNGGQ